MSTPWVFDVYLAIAIIKLERNTLDSDIETDSLRAYAVQEMVVLVD